MKVTWWGHSTATIDDSGVRVLTDPVLVDRLAHLRRRRGPTPAPEARDADAVLLSHLHADHTHLASLRLLPPTVRLLAPRGARRLLDGLRGGLGDRCTELCAGDVATVGALQVQAVPAEHDGRRHPGSRHAGPALGFVVSGEGRTYFAGDTDLHDAMDGLGPLDLALMPIGGWGPTLGRGHLDPVRAAEAVQRCGARAVVPIHWGTLWPIGMDRVRPHLFSGPGPRFRAAMAERGLDAAVHVLEPGGTLDWPGRSAAGRRPRP